MSEREGVWQTHAANACLRAYVLPSRALSLLSLSVHFCAQLSLSLSYALSLSLSVIAFAVAAAAAAAVTTIRRVVVRTTLLTCQEQAGRGRFRLWLRLRLMLGLRVCQCARQPATASKDATFAIASALLHQSYVISLAHCWNIKF